MPASLSTVCPVFTLGIYMGEFLPRQVLYSPAKEPLYQAKVGYFCSKKLSVSGASPPDPMNKDSAPGPRWGNSPQTPSSHVHPLVSTVSGHPQFLAVWFQNIVIKCVKSFSFWGTSSPRPIPELCPWATLGDSRSSYNPAPLAVLSGNESLCFSLRLCFSNDLFIV